METPNLHDTILVDLVLRWGKHASLEARFEYGSRVTTLVAREVWHLICPHENPWGPSVFVNENRGPSEIGAGLHRVEIEMQSGDAIVIEANSFEWIAKE